MQKTVSENPRQKLNWVDLTTSTVSFVLKVQAASTCAQGLRLSWI